jgi:hypothetical protein
MDVVALRDQGDPRVSEGQARRIMQLLLPAEVILREVVLKGGWMITGRGQDGFGQRVGFLYPGRC